MEVITDRDPTYGNMNWNTKNVCQWLGQNVPSFPFIVSFIITMNSMSIIKPIHIELQKKCTDIVKAYMDV